jgi:hypothetical protein
MVGGSIAGPTAPLEEQMRGIHIYMGGIALQEFFIVLFVGVAARFQWEMGRVERMRVGDGKGKGEWKRLLWSVYAGLGFITVGSLLCHSYSYEVSLITHLGPYLVPPHRVLRR